MALTIALPSKEDIKDWLKHRSRNREWLGERLGTSKKTVDNWLSTAKEIPVGKLRLIAELMQDDVQQDQNTARKNSPQNQIFSVEVDLETFRSYNKAALAAGLTIEEWAVQELDAAASMAAQQTSSVGVEGKLTRAGTPVAPAGSLLQQEAAV